MTPARRAAWLHHAERQFEVAQTYSPTSSNHAWHMKNSWDCLLVWAGAYR